MSILWLVVLLVLGWPVALFCAGFYILFAPFSACLGDACNSITDILRKGVEWPGKLGKAIVDGSNNAC